MKTCLIFLYKHCLYINFTKADNTLFVNLDPSKYLPTVFKQNVLFSNDFIFEFKNYKIKCSKFK